MIQSSELIRIIDEEAFNGTVFVPKSFKFWVFLIDEFFELGLEGSELIAELGQLIRDFDVLFEFVDCAFVHLKCQRMSKLPGRVPPPLPVKFVYLLAEAWVGHAFIFLDDTLQHLIFNNFRW